MELTLNTMRLEGEFIFSDTGRRPIAEFAGPSDDAAAAVARAAGGGEMLT